MSDYKHGRITKYYPEDENGEQKIISEGYHEQKSSYKEEWLKHIPTSKDSFLKDLMTSVDPLVGQKTTELYISIVCDDKYQPRLITRTYTVKKQNFKKR